MNPKCFVCCEVQCPEGTRRGQHQSQPLVAEQTLNVLCAIGIGSIIKYSAGVLLIQA